MRPDRPIRHRCNAVRDADGNHTGRLAASGATTRSGSCRTVRDSHRDRHSNHNGHSNANGHRNGHGHQNRYSNGHPNGHRDGHAHSHPDPISHYQPHERCRADVALVVARRGGDRRRDWGHHLGDDAFPEASRVGRRPGRCDSGADVSS